MEILTIPERFCGPDIAANGGYAAGVLAGPSRGPMRVTLRAPVPMNTTLFRVVTPTGLELHTSEGLVAEATEARGPSAPTTG